MGRKRKQIMKSDVWVRGYSKQVLNGEGKDKVFEKVIISNQFLKLMCLKLKG